MSYLLIAPQVSEITPSSGPVIPWMTLDPSRRRRQSIVLTPETELFNDFAWVAIPPYRPFKDDQTDASLTRMRRMRRSDIRKLWWKRFGET